MKNMMEYNNYYAKIEYSNEDGCFFGTVAGINDVVSFEGKSIKKLKEAFVESIDDYCDMCKRIGKTPEKTYKGSFNIRINPKLHKKAALIAATNGISLNQFVERAIEKYVLH
ncbi:MAG: type II toxin-antitoxin system HicB family antitoxin [Clostridia bacterium]|nr:type II toxin-antitoxin system HicB family antitoxin [Clostridia bacterium]